ncbi:MAG: MarP family serine protease [Microthrixaceae bacterium]
MNGLDVVLLVMAVLAAALGWRLGFLTRAFGWIGAALGLGLAVVLVPRALRLIDWPSDTLLLVAGVLALVAVASLGQGIGSAIGARLRPPARSRGARRIDALGGCALGLLGVAVLAWLVLPFMSNAKGWPAEAARSSVLARFAAERLPAPPDQLAELEQQLAQGDFPELFSDARPVTSVPPPPKGSNVSAAALARLSASSVRLEGQACDTIQTGSGFVVAPGLVVTNAHVVAGTKGLEVRTTDDRTTRGTVVAFDPSVDLALVATDLNRPVLRLAEPEEGRTGLVLGFPGGGRFDPSPFSVAGLLDARGYDIYDRDLVDRRLVVLSSDLAPGDSGSAVATADGTAVGVAVAVAPDRPGVAYALAPAQVRELLASLGGSRAAVGTGPCLQR